MKHDLTIRGRLAIQRLDLPPLGSDQTEFYLVTGIKRYGRPEVGRLDRRLGLRRGRGLDGTSIPGNVLQFTILGRPILRDGSILLVGIDEAVEPIKWVVPDADHQAVAVYLLEDDDSGMGSSASGPRIERGTTALAEELLDVEQYLSEITRVIELGQPRTTAAHRFFIEFDRQTHFKLYPFTGITSEEIALRNDAIREIMIDLRLRFEERHRKHVAGLVAEDSHPEHGLSPNHRGFLQYVSSIQRRVIEGHFGAGAAFDVDGMENAFEQFANGQLRIHLPSGACICQPSSGYYYFFAEFAMLALEENVDSDLWERVVNVMVRSQEMFADVYGPRLPAPSDTTYASYGPHAFEPARRHSNQHRQETRTAFADLPVRHLEAKVAANSRSRLPGLR